MHQVLLRLNVKKIIQLPEPNSNIQESKSYSLRANDHLACCQSLKSLGMCMKGWHKKVNSYTFYLWKNLHRAKEVESVVPVQKGGSKQSKMDFCSKEVATKDETTENKAYIEPSVRCRITYLWL